MCVDEGEWDGRRGVGEGVREMRYEGYIRERERGNVRLFSTGWEKNME